MARYYLTRYMRDVLIEHLDGREVPLIVGDSHRQKTMASLLARELVRTSHRHQRHTVITEAGRAELAKALADWANALSRAGCGAESADSPPRPFARGAGNAHSTGPSEGPHFPLDSA